jgi:hypothetical protein
MRGKFKISKCSIYAINGLRKIGFYMFHFLRRSKKLARYC